MVLKYSVDSRNQIRGGRPFQYETYRACGKRFSHCLRLVMDAQGDDSGRLAMNCSRRRLCRALPAPEAASDRSTIIKSGARTVETRIRESPSATITTTSKRSRRRLRTASSMFWWASAII